MLKINRNSKSPIYQQIYEQIRNDILSGNLPEGFRITSTRALASELQVGRNSVESAYTQLVLEGYLTSVLGSGYIVNKLEFDLHQELPQEKNILKVPQRNLMSKHKKNIVFSMANLKLIVFQIRFGVHMSQICLMSHK